MTPNTQDIQIASIMHAFADMIEEDEISAERAVQILVKTLEKRKPVEAKPGPAEPKEVVP